MPHASRRSTPPLLLQPGPTPPAPLRSTALRCPSLEVERHALVRARLEPRERLHRVDVDVRIRPGPGAERGTDTVRRDFGVLKLDRHPRLVEEPASVDPWGWRSGGGRKGRNGVKGGD